MAGSLRAYLEVGARRTFAGAVGWPGWCRSGRNEQAALAALAEYGQRYAAAIAATGIPFSPPDDASAFTVVQRADGDATTDFGAPGKVLEIDGEPIDDAESDRLLGIVNAAWAAFDATAAVHRDAALRKGPRGGGRELEAIVAHVLDADGAYLRSMGGRWKADDAAPVDEEMARLRAEVHELWTLRRRGEDPPRIPRAGVAALWPLRYFARRSAWHALDHAWEIEDRADQ